MTAAAPEFEGVSCRPESRLRFALPFRFERDTIADRIGSLIGMTVDHWTSAEGAPASGPVAAPVWGRSSLAHARLYLLPHLGAFINTDPATVSPHSSRAAAHLMSLTPAGVRALRGDRHHANWALKPRYREPLQLRIEAADVMLLELGIGVLVITICVLDDTAAAWFEALHSLRFAAGERAPAVYVCPDGFRDVSECPVLLTGRKENVINAATVFRVLLTGGRIDTEEYRKSWWQPIFLAEQLVPYSSVFLDGASADDHQRMLLAHRLRFAFGPTQDVSASAAMLNAVDDDGLPYAERMLFTCAVDGGGFLACDAPETEFWKSTLPSHLQAEYLLVFLVVLAQRTALVSMSKRVAEQWAQPVAPDETSRVATSAQAFAGLLGSILEYTARLEFAQIFHTQHHHACYELWRRAFEVSLVYEEVRSEVDAMRAFLDERAQARANEQERSKEARQRRFERLIYIITFLVLPAQIPIGLFAARLADWPGVRDWNGTAEELGTLVFLVVVSLLGLAFYLRGRVKSHPGVATSWRGLRGLRLTTSQTQPAASITSDSTSRDDLPRPR